MRRRVDGAAVVLVVLAGLVALGGLAVAPPAAAQRAFPPVDEAAARPALFAFRAALQAAVARRDAAAVTAALDPAVQLSFGGDAGPAAFERIWRPRSPGSALWETLGTALALGGAFDGPDRFVAPWVAARWPAGLDPFGHVAVVGTDVRARAAPSGAAPTVARLDASIVELAPGADPDAPWVAVRLSGGRAAWIERRHLRSPVGWRVALGRGADGRWRIVSLLAGD